MPTSKVNWKAVPLLLLSIITLVTFLLSLMLSIPEQARAGTAPPQLPAQHYPAPTATVAAHPASGCQPLWTVANSPNVGTESNYLSGLAVLSPNDAWAVGWNGTSVVDEVLIEHWNGSDWSIVPAPHPESLSRLLAVTALGPNNIWAVGLYGSSQLVHTLVERWDGSQWTQVQSPNRGPYSNFLSSISAISANDIWAVGNCQTLGQTTLTMHWDGSVWLLVPSPDPQGRNGLLYGVSAV